MKSAHTSPGFLLALVAAFVGTFVGSVAAGYLGLVGTLGFSHPLLNATVGTQVVAWQLLAVVGLVAVVRAAIGTVVVSWIIGHGGAWVSVPRMFGSLLLGDVAGQLITIAWLIDERGGLSRGAGLDALTLPLMGVVLSALLLSAPRAPARRQASSSGL